jgi:hypothetical protein
LSGASGGRIITAMTDEEFQRRLASLPNPPFSELYEEFQDGSAAQPEPPLGESASELLKVATHTQRAMLREMLRNKFAAKRLTPEERISRALRRALERIDDGADFLDSLELRRMCVGLEYFLPAVLAEVYPSWKNESLDGFYFSEARKSGSRQAELFGMCISISDQALAPLHLRLRVAKSEDQIEWMECRLGKRGTREGDMERVNWQQWRHNPLAGLPDSKDLIDWVFKITFGA